jgi:hypothetical protein
LEAIAEDLAVMYDFIYKNFDLFRILLIGAGGSAHSDFIHVLVKHEVNHTLAYLERLGIGRDGNMRLDTTVIHTISEGYFNALLEQVCRGISHGEALGNLDFIVTFYAGGWLNVFGRCRPL